LSFKDYSQKFYEWLIANPGRNATREPITAELTVGATAAEAKVGASALASRIKLELVKIDTGMVYWGGSDVTVANGVPIFSGNEVKEFFFDPETATPIYLIAPTDTKIRIAEW